MRLTVVKKMVIGFTGLASLLLVTSWLSYLGLADIKQSAEKVAHEKMPIQRVVSSLNVDILQLGTITTNGYFENESAKLDALNAEFSQGHSAYIQKLDTLSSLVSNDNHALLKEIQQSSDRYLTASKKMFEAKFAAHQTLIEHLQGAFSSALATS